MRLRHASGLETLTIVVPEAAVPVYEAALQTVCGTVGIFLDDDTGLWHVEGVRDRFAREDELTAGLALAGLVTGVAAAVARRETPAEGWLARSYQGFPEQLVGRRFAIRGTHLAGSAPAGRRLLVLDAGIAFGSGEHGSTRGCLRALERVAFLRPQRILDLGTGSGVLAMAAAALLHRPVLGSDIEPWSVRVAAQNARLNRLGRGVRFVLGNGWRSPAVRAGAPYDLVFANILARPLCLMAADLGRRMAPGGTVILAGLLGSQRRQVLAAHRRQGLVLWFALHEGSWTTLVLRKPTSSQPIEM